MRVLVVNAGSSTLKVSVVGPDDEVSGEQEFEAPGGHVEEARLDGAIRAMGGVEAVGHRVVHGGQHYPESVRIDAEVIRYLVSITDLAPLLRRYGFHGFSHAWAARRAAQILESPGTGLKVVTCHLGSGASVAAVWGGRSMDTTMGFTPLEGLVMATRSGSIDPGLVLWLQRHAGLSEAEMMDALDRYSGLQALAGTGDMRQLLEKLSAGDEDARLAFDVYVHRLRACIASMAAAMAGMDVLVFTGGVGENASPVRAATVSGLRFLGVEIDRELNAHVTGDADISAPSAAVPTLVVKAHEDIEVAREVRRVLSAPAG